MPKMTYTGTQPITLAICEPHLKAEPGEIIDVAAGLVDVVKPLGFEEVADAPAAKAKK